MSQTANTTANTTAANNLFASAAALPTPVCVTAFIAPQSLLELNIYADGTASTTKASALISVGTYMSDRSIWHICNFTNAANALNYAFMLKGDNCPISKNAFALLQAEIKRTGAVSNRAKARAEAKAKAEAEVIAEKEAEPQKEAEPKAEKVEPVAVTPILRQYKEMKKKHPDAILLFRVGDFYEIFGEDAITASDVLGITLTRRVNGKKSSIELAGFPHHALDTYLPTLVRAGHRVAICEQLEEPKVKKSVKEA